MRYGTLIVAVFVLATAVEAADECVTVDGDRIRAADLARAYPVFRGLDPELFIAYSPIPGVERVLDTGQLRRLARRHALPDEAVSRACFVRASEKLPAERVLEALRDALKLPAARVELVDFSRQPVPRGRLSFDRSGLPVPPKGAADTAVLWRGSVHYGERHSVPVWARVRISVSRRQVVAVNDLRAGRRVEASEVTEEKTEGFPESEPPLETVQEVIGTTPRRGIRAGEPLYASDLRMPNDIERGETVRVEVTCGAALLRFQAKAETSGRRGDRVLVRNPVSGRRFAALVEGKAVVSVRTSIGKEGL